MVNEYLEATLDDSTKTTSLKGYLVQITIEIPYPKTLEFREQASGIAPAVSRAIKALRKQIKGKRIKEMRIKAVQL